MGKPAPDALMPADRSAASLMGKREPQEPQKATAGKSWREDNAGWLKNTGDWQRANRVLARALTSPEEGPRGQQVQGKHSKEGMAGVGGGGDGWGGEKKRPVRRRRILSLPQRLALKLERRARLGYLDTVKVGGHRGEKAAGERERESIA